MLKILFFFFLFLEVDATDNCEIHNIFDDLLKMFHVIRVKDYLDTISLIRKIVSLNMNLTKNLMFIY